MKNTVKNTHHKSLEEQVCNVLEKIFSILSFYTENIKSAFKPVMAKYCEEKEEKLL